MTTTVSIYHPNDMNTPIHKDITLSEFATSRNKIKIQDEVYFVCQTLFTPYNNLNPTRMEFEQILERDDKKGDGSVSHLVLIGKTDMNDFESSLLFKDVKIEVGDASSHLQGSTLRLLYPYMRELDSVKIEDVVYNCNKIISSDGINAVLGFFPRTKSLELFRENLFRIC